MRASILSIDHIRQYEVLQTNSASKTILLRCHEHAGIFSVFIFHFSLFILLSLQEMWVFSIGHFSKELLKSGFYTLKVMLRSTNE